VQHEGQMQGERETNEAVRKELMKGDTSMFGGTEGNYRKRYRRGMKPEIR
jgi:hypothetical protein